MVSCPINRPPKLGSTRITSGSGEAGGGALGPKSRGGLVMTDKGAPNCALGVWAWARLGRAAAPAIRARRFSLDMSSLRFAASIFDFGQGGGLKPGHFRKAVMTFRSPARRGGSPPGSALRPLGRSPLE